MSGQVIQSPTSIDTTVIQTGQPAGSISPIDAQIIEDSLSGLFSSTKTASFTISADLRGTRVRYNAAAAGVATVPTNASVPTVIGTCITFCQTSTGQLQVSGAVGVTILAPTSTLPPATRAQYSHIWMIQDSPNVWIVGGDLA